MTETNHLENKDRPFFYLSELTEAEVSDLRDLAKRRRNYYWPLYIMSALGPIAFMIGTVVLFDPKNGVEFWPNVIKSVFPFLESKLLEMQQEYGQLIYIKSVGPIGMLLFYCLTFWSGVLVLILISETKSKVSPFYLSKVVFDEVSFSKGFLKSTSNKPDYSGKGSFILFESTILFSLVGLLILVFFFFTIIGLPGLRVINTDPVQLDLGLSFVGKIAGCLNAGLLLPLVLSQFLTYSPFSKLVGLTDADYENLLMQA